jgi:hypothetical protein
LWMVCNVPQIVMRTSAGSFGTRLLSDTYLHKLLATTCALPRVTIEGADSRVLPLEFQVLESRLASSCLLKGVTNDQKNHALKSQGRRFSPRLSRPLAGTRRHAPNTQPAPPMRKGFREPDTLND